jgi:hypothetical protein
VVETPEPVVEAAEPVAEAANVPLATATEAVPAEPDADEEPGAVTVTSNGHWTVVEQPPVTTRPTRRVSRRTASRPAGPPASAAQPEVQPAPQPADQHESADSQGEQAPV